MRKTPDCASLFWLLRVPGRSYLDCKYNMVCLGSMLSKKPIVSVATQSPEFTTGDGGWRHHPLENELQHVLAALACVSQLLVPTRPLGLASVRVTDGSGGVEQRRGPRVSQEAESGHPSTRAVITNPLLRTAFQEHPTPP